MAHHLFRGGERQVVLMRLVGRAKATCWGTRSDTEERVFAPTEEVSLTAVNGEGVSAQNTGS